jgi:hypothetical protein
MKDARSKCRIEHNKGQNRMTDKKRKKEKEEEGSESQRVRPGHHP